MRSVVLGKSVGLGNPLGLTAAVAVLLAMTVPRGDRVLAQSASEPEDALRRQIEQRFDVLPLQTGVALRPKSIQGVRSIEITDGNIAIDGTPVTGAELRAKLGSDADLVLRLSYLDPDARQRLLSVVVLPDRVAEPPDDSRDRDRDRDRRRRFGRSGGDQVRFAGNVTVEEGEVVNGDVVAIGGSVRVEGAVTGNAVAVGGSLALGSHADIGGDAVVIGGTLRRDPGAHVGGKVVDVASGNFDFSRFRFGRFPFGRRFSFPFENTAFGVVALMGTLSRVAVLSVLASLVLLVGRTHVERVGARAAAEPVKAAVIGLLAQLLFLPMLVMTILVLVVTLIGIPFLALIPIALLALAAIGLVGFTAVAYS